MGKGLGVASARFSDLAGAKRLRMQAAFVLSGKYRDKSVIESIPAPQRPDITVEAIGGLLPTLE